MRWGSSSRKVVPREISLASLISWTLPPSRKAAGAETMISLKRPPPHPVSLVQSLARLFTLLPPPFEPFSIHFDTFFPSSTPSPPCLGAFSSPLWWNESDAKASRLLMFRRSLVRTAMIKEEASQTASGNLEKTLKCIKFLWTSEVMSEVVLVLLANPFRIILRMFLAIQKPFLHALRARQNCNLNGSLRAECLRLQLMATAFSLVGGWQKQKKWRN